MNEPTRNLAWLAKHHFGKLRALSFVLCLSPALWLGAEHLSGALGVNPLNRLLHFTGSWALTLLAVTLSVTPLRRFSMKLSQTVHARYGKRISDWNWLIRLRRQFGLFTFFYACLHVAVYVTFDAGLDFEALRDDVLQRPFIVIGLGAFLLLVPLAATSNQAAMRSLGGHWRRLHTLTYAIAVLALWHYWAHVKVGNWSPVPYSIVVGLLLAFRVVAWRMGDRSASAEVKERPDRT
jgi:sulfoxide reductase heme-binding subunit YedZ